jgi:hypothetical protein
VTTSRLGRWTLVLHGDHEAAKRIARAIEWRAGRDGFFGPELARFPPDAGGGGRWCASGYWVDAFTDDDGALKGLHATLRIVPTGE